jgi:hypothetical protein
MKQLAWTNMEEISGEKPDLIIYSWAYVIVFRFSDTPSGWLQVR